MIGKIKKNIQVGFGKKETVKTAKGAAVGGVGAVAYTIISNLGYMPSALSTPDLVPYVVAGLSTVINAVRQFLKNNGIGD